MREIAFYIQDHLLIYTRRLFIIPYLSLLIILIIINYRLGLDGKIYNSSTNFYIRLLQYLFLYGGGYYLTVLWLIRNKKHRIPFSYRAFLTSLTLIILLAIEKSSSLHIQIVDTTSFYPYAQFIGKILKQLSLPFLIIVIGGAMLGFKLIMSDAFGLKTREIDFIPYFKILALLLPIIIAGSFFNQFSMFYPKYKTTLAPLVSNLHEGFFVGIFEISYAINLFSLEIFIHGLLILGMVKHIGKECIYPAVTIYCFYHFGKPVMECSLSILGGYLLGVISLYTRSVLGGTIIHIGIAWMMETAAWIQNNFLMDH